MNKYCKLLLAVVFIILAGGFAGDVNNHGK